MTCDENISPHRFYNNGRLAQLVEHWSNKPRVAGSSPVVTIFFLYSKKEFLNKKKFPNRELNPGLSGESRVSWPPRLLGSPICFRPGSNRRPWDYETHALPTAPRKRWCGRGEETNHYHEKWQDFGLEADFVQNLTLLRHQPVSKIIISALQNARLRF